MLYTTLIFRTFADSFYHPGDVPSYLSLSSGVQFQALNSVERSTSHLLPLCSLKSERLHEKASPTHDG